MDGITDEDLRTATVSFNFFQKVKNTSPQFIPIQKKPIGTKNHKITRFKK